MKCPKCHYEFDAEEEEEDKVIVNLKKYEKILRFACIGELALAKK